MRRMRTIGPGNGITAMVSAGLRLVLATIAGLVLVVSALMFGLFLGAVVLTWKVLGGRGAKTRSRPAATQGDVIDVEVREVVMRETRTS